MIREVSYAKTDKKIVPVYFEHFLALMNVLYIVKINPGNPYKKI